MTKLFSATVKFKDNGDVCEHYLFKVGNSDENNIDDESIFCYIDDESDIVEYMKEDSANDFIVLSYKEV